MEEPFKNEYGQINNTDAWTLAHMERNEGREAAARHEEALEKGFENEEEQYNAGVMELLKEEFPEAIQEVVDEETGEKIYIAGISVFDRQQGKFRPTLESQELINNEFTKTVEEVRGNGLAGMGFQLLRIGEGFTGLTFTKFGILQFTDMENLEEDLIKQFKRGGAVSMRNLKFDEQSKIFKALDFLNRYGKELRKDDGNSLDQLKERIGAVKSMH